MPPPCRPTNALRTTLSATIREAWDRDVLMTTAKTLPERASGAHVTILGHITPEELRRELPRARSQAASPTASSSARRAARST